MRISNSYLINDNTVYIVPIISEKGSVYTLVVEKERSAIIKKSPSDVVEESKRFYMLKPKKFNFERKWGSVGEVKGKELFQIQVQL